MLIRNCAGGVVFYGDKVLLIENDKHEWAFPKGVVRSGNKMIEVAVERIKIECGLDVKILAPCGKTHYEFYSVSRRKPVHNNISWFIMESSSGDVKANQEEHILDGKFFTVTDALDVITYSQDKTLLMMAYQRFKEIKA